MTFTTQRTTTEYGTVVSVRWNDANNTALDVMETGAIIFHGADIHHVPAVSKNLEATRRHWTRKINLRLAEIEAAKPKPVGKFGQMVRNGWKPLKVADVYQ